MPEQKSLVLIDGASYLFRAYHALPPLTNSRGQPTGAVKGVINMIRNLVKTRPDSYIAVIFDAKGKTFRHDRYPQYKANRPPMPDDLRGQIEPIHKIIKAMGLPLIVQEGVEADDVIGTLARQASTAQIPTLVSTGDKDLAQLVNEHVTLLNTMTDEVLDIEGVKHKFGLPPERIIDYLALMGDKSDNIPGVPGVGPKTAVKWLREFGSLEEVISQAEQIPGKVGENLRSNISQLTLSRELATIKLDVELEFGPQDLVHGTPDRTELLSLYRSLEFRTWIRELEDEGALASPPADTSSAAAAAMPRIGDSPVAGAEDSPAAEVPAAANYQTIQSLEALREAAAAAENAGLLAISIETDGEHCQRAQIIGLGLCAKAGEACYIPLGHDYLEAPKQLPPEEVWAGLRPVLESKEVFKIGHDLKSCSHLLRRRGVSLRGRRFDVMLQSYVLNSTAHKHDLENIAARYLEVDKRSLQDLLGKGRHRISFAQLEVQEATRWSAQNADYCWRLHRLLKGLLERDGELEKVYRHYEIALLPALTRMEEAGLKLDVKVLAEQSQELHRRLLELEKAAFDLAGQEFNLGSPKQLQEIFYQQLSYPVIAKTATGQPSTAEPVLQELAMDYPLPKVILEYRGLSKLKSTYTDRLPQDLDPRTRRIHSNFQQAVAATGRLSSTDPNLQNIPIRTEEGRRIRQAFIADEGHLLMAADYSQVELRIMAHLSEDADLCEAFSQGLDVHRATAAEIFSVSLEKVSEEQRRSAKAINFGLIYGMSAFGLAKQIGIERPAAQEYVRRYFQRYPGVKRYMDETRDQAREQGFVETLFGRRLHLPELKARNAVLRKAAERTAINAPMQGTAADIIKRAMVDIDHWLEVAGLDARMVLQVHDELVFEVAEDDLELLAQGVKFRMASAASLRVPLVVDIGYGSDWNAAH